MKLINSNISRLDHWKLRSKQMPGFLTSCLPMTRGLVKNSCSKRCLNEHQNGFSYLFMSTVQTSKYTQNDNTPIRTILSKVRQTIEIGANGGELLNNFVNSSINDNSSLGLKPGKRKRIATFHAAVACFQTQSTSCHI